MIKTNSKGKMEHLYLKWWDKKTNEKIIIGALFRDKERGKYYFKLSQAHVQKAIREKKISEYILPFSDFNRIYEKDDIFSIFKIRLPKIEKYEKEELELFLEDLEMKEYDEFEYLKKTKGILMTDNFMVEE